MNRCTPSVRVLSRWHSQNSTRLPPKSLMLKQADRVRRSKEGQADGSKLMLNSLRDIPSMFQASSETPEDEELEILNHQNYLKQQIEAGELKRLLRDRFNLGEFNSLISTRLLIQQFPKLTHQQLELIQEAVTMNPAKPWNEIPNYIKQLQFYFAFGSYGPRMGLPFNSSEKPLDFTFKVPSPIATNGKMKIKKLNKSLLANLHNITDERLKLFKTTRLDLPSRCILWSAIFISMLIAVQEWEIKQDPETKVTILDNSF